MQKPDDDPYRNRNMWLNNSEYKLELCFIELL